MLRIVRISALGRATSNITTVMWFSTRGANTFYDSQSGSFITKPGSGGIRIHDFQFKCAQKVDSSESPVSDKSIVDYIREASGTGKVTSVSLPIIESDEAFRKYMELSIPYLVRNRQNLSVKVASQLRNTTQLNILDGILAKDPQAKNVLEAEVDILVQKNTQHQDSSTNSSALVFSSASLATKGLVTRANLYICIDPLVRKNDSELLSVIEVGEIFAGLCDVGVKVINICLCSSENITTGDLLLFYG